MGQSLLVSRELRRMISCSYKLVSLLACLAVVVKATFVANQEDIDGNKRIEAENEKLTSALKAAMEDKGHMSEKLLMSEKANEELKTKLAELSSEAEQAVERLSTSADATFTQKDLMAKLKRKVDEVKDSQKNSEKCRTEYDTVTSYEQQCSTSYEQECSTVQEQQCSTVYEQECTSSNEQQCSTSN